MRMPIVVLTCFCALAGLCAGLWAHESNEVTHAAPMTVLTELSGGTAIIFESSKKMATVGAVLAPKGGDQRDYNDHWLDFVVEVGTVDGEVSVPPSGYVRDENNKETKTPYWRLYRDSLRYCPGGKCVTTSTLDLGRVCQVVEKH